VYSGGLFDNGDGGMAAQDCVQQSGAGARKSDEKNRIGPGTARFSLLPSRNPVGGEPFPENADPVLKTGPVQSFTSGNLLAVSAPFREILKCRARIVQPVA
jgi:hypothetical protein